MTPIAKWSDRVTPGVPAKQVNTAVIAENQELRKYIDELELKAGQIERSQIDDERGYFITGVCRGVAGGWLIAGIPWLAGLFLIIGEIAKMIEFHMSWKVDV